MDVVIPLSSESTWEDNELRFALRALEVNFVDLDRVFICGARPAWITNIAHLPTADRHANRDANTIDALLTACKAGVSDRFLRCCDDDVFARPLSENDIPRYHAADILATDDTGSRWSRRLRRTGMWLRSCGKPSLNYDTHTPKIYDRNAFREIMSKSPYGGHRGLTIESTYFNQVDASVAVRIAQSDALWVTGHAISPIVPSMRFINYDDPTPPVRRLLQELYPRPSRFEADGGRGLHRANVIVENLGICMRCPERPPDCWKTIDYGCQIKYRAAAMHAARKASCPIDKLT